MTTDQHCTATVERAAQAVAEAEEALRQLSPFVARRERTKTFLHDLRVWEKALSDEGRPISAASLKAAANEAGRAVEHARELASGANAEQRDAYAVTKSAISLSSALRDYARSMMETAESGAGATHAESE